VVAVLQGAAQLLLLLLAPSTTLGRVSQAPGAGSQPLAVFASATPPVWWMAVVGSGVADGVVPVRYGTPRTSAVASA